MVQIFACATALLSPEFVEGFEPETLASKFIKVEKEYSVKFKKTKSSFNIIGHWKSVQDAHCSLLQLIPDKRSAFVPNLPKSRPLEGCTPSDSGLLDKAPDSTNLVTTIDEEDHHEVTPADNTSGGEQYCRIKGNPKRGRHVLEKNQTSNLPEPYVYIHFQDQSFADENSVNMEKVLDEFEKGPTSNNVTKEDLKRVLEKNTEQMGRPSNKFVTSEARLKENKKIQSTVLDDFASNQKMNKIMIEGNQLGNNVSFESTKENEIIQQRDLNQSSVMLTNTNFQTIRNVQQQSPSIPQSRDLTTFGNGEGNIGNTDASTTARLYSARLNSTVATNMLQGTNRDEWKEVWGNNLHRDKDHQGGTSHQTENLNTSLALNETEEQCSIRGDIEQAEVGEKHVPELHVPGHSGSQASGYSSCRDMGSFKGTVPGERTDVVKNSSTTVNKEKKEQKVKGQTSKNKKKKKPVEGEQKKQKQEGLPVIATKLGVDKASIDTGKQSVENKDTVFKCPHCDYQGSKRKRLTEHMGRVHGLLTENCRGAQDSTPFKCNLCDKTFVFGKDLNRHKKIVHHSNRFYCDKCNKMYKSKYVFDRHMATHVDGYKQPMFKCQVCSREFTTKFSLGCHIKSEHLGIKKTYICPTCGKSFSQIRSYRQHANVHAGIRPYVCEVCGKSFTYDKSLKEHRFMHDDVRRFPCTVCNKAFRQRTCLLIHMKVHKDSKDHICSSCGKGFTQKQSLIRHERIHSGDKPYLCILCSKTFSDYAVIRKHLLMSHKKDKNDWKEFVVAEEKKMSDHYIAGGPGYVKRETSEKIREKNQATIIPAAVPGGRPFIMEDVHRDSSQNVQSALENVNIQVNRTDIAREQVLKENLGAGDFTISQSTLASYQVLLYANSDSEQGQSLIQSLPKQDNQVPQATVNLSYPVNYSSLQNLANSAYVISPTSEHVNVTDENILSSYSSSILAPLPGVNCASLEHDPRVESLNPNMMNSQSTMHDLGQPDLNVTSSSSAVVSATEPLLPNLSLTAAALSTWGLNGYPTYFNQSNLHQFQQQE